MAANLLAAPGTRVQSAGLHAFIVAMGGGLWAFFGSQGLYGQYSPGVQIVVVLVAAALAGAGLLLRMQARKLPQGGQDAYGGRFGYYLQVVRWEYIGMALVVILANARHQQQWIMPLVAAIVGVHFFALMNVLDRTSALVRGVLLCLTAVVTVVALPVHAALNGHDVLVWALVPGAACALVLWADSVAASLRGYQALRQAS